MKNVCVITGGGSGMGLAAAKCMPKEKIILVTGRTLSKLEAAVGELKELGYEAYAKSLAMRHTQRPATPQTASRSASWLNMPPLLARSKT